jgi:1,4-dihydroxy-2-naphthoate octaprenyltransferase
VKAASLLRAVRAPSLTAGAMPVVTANALAAHRGYGVDGRVFLLTLGGMVLVQSAVNLINDYFDHRSGLDADPEFEKSPFPLGSRVIQRGEMTPTGMLLFASACFAAAGVVGVVLDRRHDGHVVLGIAIAGGLLGYFYTAPPLRIAYRGVGEPVTFLLFGPLAGLGSYYVQTGTVDAAAVLLSSIVGVLAMAILFLHHFPQFEADARYGKKTPIVRLGPRRAGRMVPVLLGLPYLLVAAGVAADLLPWPTLAFVLTAPWALQVSRAALTAADDERRMARAVGGVLAVHFFGGLVLSAALWLA